jgi:Tfp pilus assembly protein PilE
VLLCPGTLLNWLCCLCRGTLLLHLLPFHTLPPVAAAALAVPSHTHTHTHTHTHCASACLLTLLAQMEDLRRQHAERTERLRQAEASVAELRRELKLAGQEAAAVAAAAAVSGQGAALAAASGQGRSRCVMSHQRRAPALVVQ